MILLWGMTGDEPLTAVTASLHRRNERYALIDQRDILDTTVTWFKRDPEAARIFLHKDGSAYQPGERLVQKDLARTLEATTFPFCSEMLMMRPWRVGL